jgi:hypothetical protein
MVHWKQADNSITTKSGPILLLGLLLLVIALTGIFSLFLVQRASDAIRVNTEIQRLILEMDRDLETARHYHAGFFLYYARVGFQNAHEDYAQASIRKTAKVVAASQTLKDRINDPRASHAFLENQTDLNLYLSSARRFADTSINSFELATQLAAPGTGFEQRLEAAVNELKSLTAYSEPLFSQARTIEDFIQKYRVKQKRPLMQSAFNIIFDIHRQLPAIPGTASDKDSIDSVLTQIETLADRILTIHVAIDSIFKDFMLQEQAARDISKNSSPWQTTRSSLRPVPDLPDPQPGHGVRDCSGTGACGPDHRFRPGHLWRGYPL